MFDFWSVYSGERFRASWPSCYLMWFNGSYMGLWDIGLGIYVWDLSRCNLHGWLEGRFGPIWYPHLKQKKKKRRRRRMWDYCNSVPLYALRGIEYFISIVREVSSKEILCFIFDRVVSPCWVFLAHLSHRLRVSYCHWPMSVVRRLSSTIALNNISSETARPRALIFGM